MPKLSKGQDKRTEGVHDTYLMFHQLKSGGAKEHSAKSEVWTAKLELG
jgi:hypothetical protein